MNETPAQHNAKLPRASPEEVQSVLDDWKRKRKIEGPASEKDRGDLRAWAYRIRNHFFSPGDIFDFSSWSVEDVAELRKALEAM